MRIDNSGSLIQPSQRPAATVRVVPDDLRAALTPEELNYFAELERLGPLTYGRRGATAASQSAPAQLGQRLDVKA